jgi:PAS domain S-box-containing protein
MEVLGQLLAVHNVLQLLAGPQQAAEFAAHTLRILPEARATGAVLDGCEAREGTWGSAWEAGEPGERSLAGPEWRAHPDGDVLVIPVGSVLQEHGRLVVLAGRRAQIERYVPSLGNFASALALALDNRRHEAELETASERLRQSEQRYRQLFSRMTPGFALHEIITGDAGQPIDYRFLEANPAFEKMTGLPVDEILGRTVLEVLPDLEHSWIERYGAVALGGEAIEFESFAAPLGRDYMVVAYSPEPGQFAAIFTDVTERHAAEQALRESARAAAAQEERTRLARDLHDSITQALFAAALKAEALMQDDAIPSGSAETAEQVRRLTRGALAQMRTLLLELRAQALEEVPIEQLLRNVAEATEGRADVTVAVTLRGDGAPPPELHTALYRVTQEALNNVVRHSGASSASVELLAEPGRVRLLIHDDGCGFEPGPVPSTHYGLRSMRERAAEVGGELRVVSAPGEGTLVMLEWLADRAPKAGLPVA